MTPTEQTQMQTIDYRKLNRVIERIQFTASRRHALDSEDYSPSNASSLDDAFESGYQSGEIDLARFLCGLAGIEFTVEGE